MSKTSRQNKRNERESTKLPYVFDLHWDYKTLADVDEFFRQFHKMEDKASEIRRLLAEHGLKHIEYP